MLKLKAYKPVKKRICLTKREKIENPFNKNIEELLGKFGSK